MKRNNFKKSQKTVKAIAEKENISVDEVRWEMALAIAEGLHSADPDVQEMWKNVPCKGETPEPEEVIAWVAEMVKEKLKS